MGHQGILRAVFAGALIAGASYYFVDTTGVDAPVAVIWKGAGVALLALWCAMQAQDGDGWLIAAVMAFGALGDVLLETSGLTVGAIAFVVGHGLAITLYARSRRMRSTASQRMLAMLVVPLSVAIAVLLVPAADKPAVGVYALIVSTMAAMAWVSSFPRYRVGIGAMMFLVSDLLIFARMGPLATSPIPHLLIWPLYFGGQTLIAWGVTQTLARQQR